MTPLLKGRRLGALDLLFLYTDTAETPMHVGALLPFSAPPGGTEGFIRGLLDELRRDLTVHPPWNLKLAHPTLRRSPLQSWVEDEKFDLDYHVRRSALPAPGDERELGIMLARLHSNPMDFAKPLWELHFIEGLERDRFAVYVKIHHSLVDGFTGMRMLVDSLTEDPNETDTPLFFTLPPRRSRRPDADKASASLLGEIAGLARGAAGQAAMQLKVARALGRTTWHGTDRADLVGGLEAPPSILNGHITRNRRFATQQYSLPALKAIGKAADATVNDVALAVCGGGLRRFLAELGELPDRPLVAFVPVNLRNTDDVGGGVVVGAMLASLGTDIDDPVQRLRRVAASTEQGKLNMTGLDQRAAIAYSSLLLGPGIAQSLSAYTGVPMPGPRTLNVCVSNVPGPKRPLWFRGARLEAVYPLSIPTHGMALNITLESYADTVNFGFIGCRDTLPHLQRLAVYTGQAVAELGEALGVPVDDPTEAEAG